MIYIFVIVVCAIVGAVLWNYRKNESEDSNPVIYAPVTTAVTNRSIYKAEAMDGYSINDARAVSGRLYTNSTLGRYIVYTKLKERDATYAEIVRRLVENKIDFDNIAKANMPILNDSENKLDQLCEEYAAPSAMVDVILEASIFAEILRFFNDREFSFSFEDDYSTLALNNSTRFKVVLSNSIFSKIKKHMDRKFEKAMGKQIHSSSKGAHFVIPPNKNDYCFMNEILPNLKADEIYKNMITDNERTYYEMVDSLNQRYKLLPNKPSVQSVAHYLLQVHESDRDKGNDMCNVISLPIKTMSPMKDILSRYVGNTVVEPRSYEYIRSVLNIDHPLYDETVTYGYLKGHIVTKTRDSAWLLISNHPLLNEQIVVPDSAIPNVIELDHIVKVIHATMFENKYSEDSLLLKMTRIELFSDRITDLVRNKVLKLLPDSPYLQERVDGRFLFTPTHSYTRSTDLLQQIRTDEATEKDFDPAHFTNIANSELSSVYVDILRAHANHPLAKLILSRLDINYADKFILNKRLRILSQLEDNLNK